MAVVVMLIVLAYLPFELAGLNWTTADVCGFEQRCAGNTSDFEYRNKSCCQQCECTDVCYEKGTCCADKDGINGVKNVTKQECIPASYVPKGRLAMIFQHSYFVRTRCPETFADLETKEKCNGGRNPESLDDVIFVSSADGTVVYKNRFCSLCHGEQNPVPWKTLIANGCMKTIYNKEDNMTPESAVKTLLTKCELVYIRPEVTPAGSVLCHEDSNVISDCNKTGKWNVYDSRLVNLCHDPPEPALYYFHQSHSRITVFSNLHCYLCNGHSLAVPETCQLRELDTSRSTFLLLTLLNTNEWCIGGHTSHEAKKVTNPSETCEPGTIFDSFLGVCKKVYCPLLTIAVDGECLQFIKEFSYRVYLQLVLEEEIERSAVNDNTDLYDIIRNLLQLDKCVLCKGVIYIPRDHTMVSEMYVQLDLTTTQECERDYLLSTVANFEKSSINAAITFGQKFTRCLCYVREPWNWKATTHWDPISKKGTRCRSLYSDRRSNCPKIKLTSNEYDKVLQNHTRAKELLFSSNDVKNTMYVCLDNYFEKQSAVGVAKFISHGTVIAALVASMLRGVLIN